MNESAGRPSTRIDPETAWTVMTDSPLKGMALAREAGTILAWDEGNQLYLFDVKGESLSYSRVPSRILAGTISDEGGLIALLVEGENTDLLLLDADFSVEQQRPAPSEASFVAIDPHGRYVAVGTRHNVLHLLNRFARPVGRIETIETIAHFSFVADRPIAIGGGGVRHDGGPRARPGARRPDRRRDPLAGTPDVQRRTARRQRRRRGDPGELLHPGHPALRPEGPERGLVSSGRHGLARGPGLPRPDDRRGDPRVRAGDHELGGNVRWRTIAPAHDRRPGDRPARPLRDLRRTPPARSSGWTSSAAVRAGPPPHSRSAPRPAGRPAPRSAPPPAASAPPPGRSPRWTATARPRPPSSRWSTTRR